MSMIVGFVETQWLVENMFRGSLLGRRLIHVFGKAWCTKIFWSNCTSPSSGTRAHSVSQASPDHIADVLYIQKPEIVLCFGHIASAAVKPRCSPSMTVIVGPHPLHKTKTLVAELQRMRKEMEHAVIRRTTPSQS